MEYHYYILYKSSWPKCLEAHCRDGHKDGRYQTILMETFYHICALIIQPVQNVSTAIFLVNLTFHSVYTCVCCQSNKIDALMSKIISWCTTRGHPKIFPGGSYTEILQQCRNASPDKHTNVQSTTGQTHRQTDRHTDAGDQYIF